ncbi:MAG TPA: double-strand break repair helicase AddA [Caulobacteraceae bacterium]|jgi:ATP-dependent helicase/nuclease subunit A|nr:double-strand break repair helicase AddA [Caulobacteraceae bacterium]
MKRARPRGRPSDPTASVYVSAHAGTGKTYTLVERVTRLLLAGADPGAILCVTYTKAGAAEMQRRLFEQLGNLAVLGDDELGVKLAELGEADADYPTARALFARALETPGGLKIQTIHAFCERLLRRFPLEAGVSPGFKVMDDQAADRISRKAREVVALHAGERPGEPIGLAYRRMSIELDFGAFNDMFAELAIRRAAIAGYVDACRTRDGVPRDVWRRCGFDRELSVEKADAEAMARMRWRRWREAAAAFSASPMKSDRELGERMAAVSPTSSFKEVCRILYTAAGTPRQRLGTNSVAPADREWLMAEQNRLDDSRRRQFAARIAQDTVDVLALGAAYVEAYESAKRDLDALDFGDLVTRTLALLAEGDNAVWVHYKLDSGIEHVLLDEAQDTSPEQWRILTALTAEFFHGEGASEVIRTVFVVGDEKQSIFSFQGARPERLGIEAQDLERRAIDAGLRYFRSTLDRSWRSTPEILAFVDRVFADRDAAMGLAAAGTTLLELRHEAERGAGGCVDLWPLEAAEVEPEHDPLAPVDAGPLRSANKRLARRIALAILHMVADRDAVGEGEALRPCRWGDFLILVRRRNVLFEEIIRALKASGVPIAGADRLKLSEHGLYKDLMALGAFARFSTDDLALAGLLRSPFCDVDEPGLFDLAHARKGKLWSVLEARAAERSEWRDAALFLDWAREAARASTPFDFYGQALNRRDAAGRSMRQRLLTRLGGEAEEALDGFLAQCLTAESAGVRDMERFLDWMAATEIEIKRETTDRADEVRVMTAHGAKGLEAPIVILPDTASKVTARGTPLHDAEAGAFLWAPRKTDDCEESAKSRLARDEAAAAEYNRLLYVALTRPRDRLIVCGVEAARGHEGRFEASWGDYVTRAFDQLETHPVEIPGDDGKRGRRYGPDPVRVHLDLTPESAAALLPAWLAAPAATEAPAVRLAAPSRLVEDDDRSSATSPLESAGGLGRWRRGEIIHRLLQILPDLPPASWDTAASRLLAREIDLDEPQRVEIAAAALGVLRDERFSAVFGPGSRAEAPIAGGAATLPVGLFINGRVDRLVVAEDRVLVADYKTNRPAPPTVEGADPSYIRQMALYAAVLGEIFPGRRIEAALVWTDGPKLMTVPEPMLRSALEALA